VYPPPLDRDEREQVRRELRLLCRGRGVLAPDLRRRIGPRLAARLSDAGERGAIVDWLRGHVRQLPGDLRLAASVGLGLHPPADARFLGERLDWLAGHLAREQRTVRRRLDEALALLAELVSTSNPTPPVEPSATGGSWYSRSVRALVTLDRGEPEVFEERAIVAAGPAVDAVTLAMSIPRIPGQDPPEVLVDVLHGGLLTRTERPSASHFKFVVELPREVGPDDEHHLGLRYRLRPGQQMTPHYALIPLSRCDRFTLRVRFPAPPPTVRLLAGVPTRSLDDDPGELPVVEPDRAGEVFVRFAGLTPGLGYGLRWD
jgi:hypothetical protein